MKANQAEQLRQIIRKIVREEVSSEVNRAMGKILVEMVKEVKRTPSAPAQEVLEEEEETNMPVLQTNNPRLNGVLAETARHYKPLPKAESGESLISLMEGGFEKIGKHEVVTAGTPATKMDFLKQMVNESVRETPSALEANAPVPDALKKIFKKDFRAVIKKSKEGTGGGFFNPSAVLSGDGEAPSS